MHAAFTLLMRLQLMEMESRWGSDKDSRASNREDAISLANRRKRGNEQKVFILSGPFKEVCVCVCVFVCVSICLYVFCVYKCMLKGLHSLRALQEGCVCKRMDVRLCV